MIGEQTSACRYRVSELQEVDLEIQMTVKLERQTDPYGDLSIEMPNERIFPEELEDEFYQRIRNGVHGGYAVSNVPYLPNTELAVRILELKVSPSPQSAEFEGYKAKVGYLLEATVSGIVVTLLRSIENLRTGTEIYYE